MENEHTEIKSIASKEEHILITTNPDELLKFQEETEIPDEKQKIVIKVDEDKGYFLKKNLNEDEINFLLSKGYVIRSHVPLGGGRQENYLLKPPARESNVHFFLVKAIEEYIRSFTDKVRTYETNNPDIVFFADHKFIAVEIETGSTMDKRKDLLRNKVENLNKNTKNGFLS